MTRAALTVLLLAGGSVLAQGNVSAIDTIDSPGRGAEAERTPSQTVIPEYPRAAWLDQIEGDVLVCFSVTRSGRPYNIAVRRSDYKFFERPARDAVKISWFERIPDGEKVPPVKTCRTFQFRLEPLEEDELEDTGDDVS
jgi:TonB family protein